MYSDGLLHVKAGSKWLAILQECFEKAAGNWKIVGHPVVIIGMTSEPERVPSCILSCFKHRFSCKVSALLCIRLNATTNSRHQANKKDEKY